MSFGLQRGGNIQEEQKEQKKIQPKEQMKGETYYTVLTISMYMVYSGQSYFHAIVIQIY